MAPLGFTQCIYPANSIIMPCETGLRRDSNQRKQTAGVSLSLFCCSCSGTLSLLRFTLIITRCVPEMANLSHKVLHKTTGLKLISLWPLQNLPSFFSFLPGTSNCVRQDKWNVVVVLLFSLLNPGEYFSQAQPVSAVSGSVSMLPARPSSSRLRDCVFYDVMLQRGCGWGCVRGIGSGMRSGKITMMAEPLTFWSWPSSTESPAGWNLFAASGGTSPHVATSFKVESLLQQGLNLEARR